MRERTDDDQELSFDLIFLVASLLLLSIGTIIVYSSSFLVSKELYGSGISIIRKHLINLSLGIGVLFFMMKMDYRMFKSRTLVYLGLLGSIIALFLCFVPGIGITAGHAKRWIRVPGFAFQSSELAKMALIFFIAHFLSRKEKSIEDFSIGVLPVLIITCVIGFLIFIEPDFGTAALIIMWAVLLLFIAGMKLKHLGIIAAIGIPTASLLLFAAPYRRNRILAFVNPWDHMQDIGYQIIQSMVGFSKGGFLGAGLGEGTQKLFYLPAPHTDFIFSVVGEELGFLGVVLVLVLFGIWLWRAFSIARATNDLFGFYLVIASSSLIGLQAIINMGMSMSLVPTVGVGLPFISYGGSSMITVTMVCGLILSVSKKARL